jgi:hypothetical protein
MLNLRLFFHIIRKIIKYLSQKLFLYDNLGKQLIQL